MRVQAPPPFTAKFMGAEGEYVIRYAPIDAWDGVIDTEIGGAALVWYVDNVELDDESHMSLGGLTRGTEGVWKDCFWFDITLKDRKPIKLEYWGNQVLWRTDYPVE